ncbi:MAG: cell division protein ZapB [Deltaproteobacteria bacterium]|nr:cell division protein ZapB [Deltaproteobacteria bacterium]
MDEEGFAEQFKKLEDKVEELVRMCNELQNAKAELGKKVEKLEKSLAAKDESEQGYLEERSMIRSRMDSLLEKLDQVFE